MIGITPQQYRDRAVNSATSRNSSIGSAIGSVVGGAVSAFTGVPGLRKMIGGQVGGEAVKSFTGIPGLGSIGGQIGGLIGAAVTNKDKFSAEADESYGRLVTPMYRDQMSRFTQENKSTTDTAYRERMQSMRRNVIPNSVDYLKFI